jgi:hypothetical protein
MNQLFLSSASHSVGKLNKSFIILYLLSHLTLSLFVKPILLSIINITRYVSYILESKPTKVTRPVAPTTWQPKSSVPRPNYLLALKYPSDPSDPERLVFKALPYNIPRNRQCYWKRGDLDSGEIDSPLSSGALLELLPGLLLLYSSKFGGAGFNTNSRTRLLYC